MKRSRLTARSIFALSWNVMKKFGAGTHRPCTRKTTAETRATVGAPEVDEENAALRAGHRGAPVQAVDDPRSLRGPRMHRSRFTSSRFRVALDALPAAGQGCLP
jgi:hypothetical protein